jgi:hypothetical protein
MNRTLFILARNLGCVFVLGFLPVPFLTGLGYDGLLVSVFSISMMLIWTDGLLSIFAIQKGATEINPLMAVINKRIGKKEGVLLSRIVGSLFPTWGLLEKNLYAILAMAWIFAAVVCLNSATLLSVSLEGANAKNAYDAED